MKQITDYKIYYTKRNSVERYEPIFLSIEEIMSDTKYDSILDVGCATGWLLQEFRKRHPNKRIFGVDHGRFPKQLWKLSGDPFSEFVDINLSDMNGNGKIYSNSLKSDLVISMEVYEHINPETVKHAEVFLSDCTEKVLVFSASKDRSRGHVNRKCKAYWINRFQELGLKYSVEKTEQIIDLFLKRKVLSFYTRHVLVFER